MIRLKKVFLISIVGLALLTITCSLGPVAISISTPFQTATPVTSPSPSQSAPFQTATLIAASPSPSPLAGTPQFGPIIICENVSDDGKPINPTNAFPGGTTIIWAFFPVENMKNGQPWGRLWQRNGATYLDERNDTWHETGDDWEAYSLSDEDGFETGHYTFTLFIADKAVQQASFDIAASPARAKLRGATFGPIIFALGVNDDNEPNGPSSQFEPGTTEVYAIIPYFKMTQGQSWTREWLYKGKQIARKDLKWDGDAEGIFHASLEDTGGLPPGRYTLNLYIEGQLVRSANFDVLAPPATPTPPPTTAPRQPTATPERPSRPEDLIDPNILPAWRMLANSRTKTIRDLAQVPLTYHIPIRFGDVGSGVLAAYRASTTKCNTVPGQVLVSSAFWRSSSWEEVAATLAHELTHAVQALTGGPCYCTVDTEAEAFTVQFYVLQDLGRKDILAKKYSFAYDRRGHFSELLLWQRLKEMYSSCKLH